MASTVTGSELLLDVSSRFGRRQVVAGLGCCLYGWPMSAGRIQLTSWRNPAVVLSVVTFVAWTGISLMAPLLPLFAQELQATPVELGLTISIYALTNVIGSLLAGSLIDRWGTLLFIAGGLIVYGASHMLVAAVTSVTALILLRAIAGIGAGATLVGSRTYIARSTKPEELAFANGLISSAESAGRAGGPIAGGAIASLLTLRAPFIAVGITSVLAVLLCAFLPKSSAAAQGSTPNEDEHLPPLSFLALLIAAQFLVLAAYGGVFTLYPPFAVQAMGWSLLQMSALISAFGVGAIAAGPWLSRLADRTDRGVVAVGCLAVVAAWLFVTALHGPLALVFALAVMAGGAFAAFNGAWYAMLTASVPQALEAKVLGIVLAASQLGVAVGASVSSVGWQAAGLDAGMAMVAVVPLLAIAPLLAATRKLHL